MDFYEGRHDPDHSPWLESFAAVLEKAATDLEEWFAVSSTTVQDWLRQWQEQGLLEPARSGQRIRSWRLRAPWQGWVTGQPLQPDEGKWD